VSPLNYFFRLRNASDFPPQNRTDPPPPGVAVRNFPVRFSVRLGIFLPYPLKHGPIRVSINVYGDFLIF
jgi:hypothetical protein